MSLSRLSVHYGHCRVILPHSPHRHHELINLYVHRAWDLIGEGETVALAQLAADFLEKKGRPLRIAIDEAVWRFNNFSKYEIKDIMESKICYAVKALVHT